MQARAIFEAAIEAGKALHAGSTPRSWCRWSPPRPSSTWSRSASPPAARAVEKERETSVDYSVGTMIELPRACLMAGEIAESAEFFSFGTNDLTQTTFGLSRDDAGALPERVRRQGDHPGRPLRHPRPTASAN